MKKTVARRRARAAVYITKMAAARTSRIPAPESVATVAPFRAWRGLQHLVAGGPARAPIGVWTEPPVKIHIIRPFTSHRVAGSTVRYGLSCRFLEPFAQVSIRINNVT
jgi:hypothetical protein